jgi:hypothetical protein
VQRADGRWMARVDLGETASDLGFTDSRAMAKNAGKCSTSLGTAPLAAIKTVLGWRSDRSDGPMGANHGSEYHVPFPLPCCVR